MEQEKIIAGLQEIGGELFTVKGIHNVNHSQGHPYTIGSNHVSHAADHFNGGLFETCIIDLEKKHGGSCAHPGCHVKFEDHKSDRIVFLQLKREVKNREASECLYNMKLFLQEHDYPVAGFGFVETSEGYRILPPPKDEQDVPKSSSPGSV